MTYDQGEDQDWDSAVFLFDDEQLHQSQPFAVDPAVNPFINMPSLQGNLAGADASSDPTMMGAMPMARWATMQNKDEPWNAHRSQAGPVPLSVDTMHLQQYREAAPSDAASSTAGAHDSGYATMPFTFSAGSGEEPSSFNKDCPTIEASMKDLKPLRKTSSASSRLGVPSPNDHRHVRRLSVRDSGVSPLLSCTVKGCGRTFKLQSDLKKHNLRHEKPFRCPVADCDRFLEGFTTTNDLERHKVTKHQIFSGDTKAWRCAVPACRAKQKLWFRLDNFRQHIWRTHSKRSDEIDRIALRSALTITHSSSPQPSHSSAVTAPDSMPERDESPDQTFDGSGLPEYSMMVDGCLMNVQNNNFSSFASSSAFEGYSGEGGALSSYRSFSDAGSAPFDRSSYVPSQSISPTSYPSIPTLNEPHFGSRSMSPSHSSWLSAESAIPRVAQRAQPQAASKGFAASPQPKVVVHQAESGNIRDLDADDLQASAKAILEQGLPDDQFREILSNLLESRKASKTGPGPRSNDNGSSSREMSVSPSRGRTSISTANAAYSGAANGSLNGRAMSQSSDRSGEASSRGRTLHQNDALSINRNVFCPEDGCGKSFDRRSALDKHIRRHRKPYACTFDACSCSKAFGSKNDWKRHENSQHMQPDLWRCDKCAETYTTKRLFQSHIVEFHGVSDDREAVSAWCKRARIGVNHSGSFWCGFCPRIVTVDATKKGAMVWDERFNHIAHHFVPEQRKIEDWLPPNGRETKGQREAAAAQLARSNYFVHQQPAASENNLQPTFYQTGPISDDPLPYSPPDADVAAEPAASDLSKGFVRRGSSKRKRKDTEPRDIHRECCSCRHTYLAKISNSCVECGHAFCDICPIIKY